MTRHRRDEQGAVAVLFALLAVVLLSISALSVDLGNQWAQKKQVQAGSDLATEAGAGPGGVNLPNNGSVKSCGYGNAGALATDQAVKDISTYLANQAYPLPRSGSAIGSYNSLVAALPTQLTDCSMANGEVVYGTPTYSGGTWTVAYNKNQLSMVSPPRFVGFGLAGIMGFHGVNVNGVSTVEIRSPKFSALPFYAFSGCDYGPQTLQQPNNGHASSPVMLDSPNDNANATLTSINPTTYPVDTTGTVTEPLTLTGSGFTNVTQVGFFEPGNAVTGPPPVTTTNFTVTNGGTKINIPDLPDQTRGVSGVQEYWYIRVMIGGKWSTYTSDSSGNVTNAPMLTIGDPPLLCGQGSSSGNFGTLLLSHAGYNGADNMGAANVALGLTNSLAMYPSGGPADGTCSSAQTQTVLWNTDGTNCVDTDTGMSSKVATGGFLGLGSSAVGGNQYLLKPNGKTKCANGGTTQATTVLLGQTINNDTLSCFFLSSTTHVGDVDNSSYAGPPLISDSIYDSPRFAYVPVLSVQPANGGSKKYQIIDFRACFITDQPASAIKGDPPSTSNGFVTDNNGVVSVEVIFLNSNALPSPTVKNGTINYVGSGPKSVLLVN